MFLLLLLFVSLHQQRIVAIPRCFIVDTDSGESMINQSNATTLIGRSQPLNRSSPCSLKTLIQLEKQTIVPFEFRRLRLEQSDQQRKLPLDEQVEGLSIAVYERRSDPNGQHYCRTCQDGTWGPLVVCPTVRCDVELLYGRPRLVTKRGEMQSMGSGALYAPSTVIAVYTFGFEPHCKRCESNGQWSEYALKEHCAEIEFFQQEEEEDHSTSNA